MAGTNFHGHKTVTATEILLYVSDSLVYKANLDAVECICRALDKMEYSMIISLISQ